MWEGADNWRELAVSVADIMSLAAVRELTADAALGSTEALAGVNDPATSTHHIHNRTMQNQEWKVAAGLQSRMVGCMSDKAPCR